ncbi:MAG: hypothetical protein IT569_04645 [Leptospiraceae bacterium]|nr:hypothetical protein [Leptospiraceae bacterium]
MNKKNYPTLLILIVAVGFSFYHCKTKNRSKIVLETVTALDPRIPSPSKDDMRAILEEGKKVIAMKLGGEVELEFHDNGYLTLDELFRTIEFEKLDYYPSHAKYKYSFVEMEKATIFSDPVYRKELIGFLKLWDIASLQKFFPEKKISNYDEAQNELLKIYPRKMNWLTTLKIPGNESLVWNPAKNFQSYVDWKVFMFEQDKYDVIFTNTLIVLDSIKTPFPHSITKHAKVGGSSFESPKRDPMLGYSLLVNFLEEYGNIEGLSNPKKIEREKKNKMIGGLLFAHEFGHAFFQIPDVYDHPDSCLMNASMDKGDMEKNYDALLSDKKVCPKCEPWVRSKKNFIDGEIFLSSKKYNEAGENFLKSASTLPSQIDSDRNSYLQSVYKRAKSAFREINNAEKIREIEELEKSLK